jgi:hypothetical protein
MWGASGPVGAEGSVEKEIKKAAVPFAFRNLDIDFPGDSSYLLNFTPHRFTKLEAGNCHRVERSPL